MKGIRLCLVIVALDWCIRCAWSLKQSFVIKVCQNKTCKKQQDATHNRSLIQTFQDLLTPEMAPSVAIEESGCLTQCGKGPNVSVQRRGKSSAESLFNHVDSSHAAAVVLADGCGLSSPPILTAACEVLDKAHRGKALEFSNPCVFVLFSS